jgi:hypothetical protein
LLTHDSSFGAFIPHASHTLIANLEVRVRLYKPQWIMTAFAQQVFISVDGAANPLTAARPRMQS